MGSIRQNLMFRLFWLIAILLAVFGQNMEMAGDPPTLPPALRKGDGDSAQAKDVLPWLLDLQRRSAQSVPPKLTPGPDSSPSPPDLRAVPLLAGDYDTGGHGQFQIAQRNKQIIATWQGDYGLSIFDGTYEVIWFANDSGGKFSQECFYGPWVLKDPKGKILRNGMGAVYPAPDLADTIVIESWEEQEGRLLDKKVGRFARSTGAGSIKNEDGPSDDEGFE